MTVFIYGLADPRSGCIRYVGKTSRTLKERYRRHISTSKRKGTYKENWIQSILRHGEKPGIVLLEECAEDNWQEREVAWIASFPKEQLTNSTIGGELGAVFTPEIRAKLRGENNASSKLTRVQVSEIKEKILACEGTITEIADTYGVSDVTIGSIGHSKSWGTIKPHISEEAWKKFTTRKLIEEQASGIKRLILERQLISDEIAEMFAVCRVTILNIAKGKCWGDTSPRISEEAYEKYKVFSIARGVRTAARKNRKLTEPQVSEIKKLILLHKYSCSEIAEKYSIGDSVIEQIARGGIWKAVEPTVSKEAYAEHKKCARVKKLTEVQVSEIKGLILSCKYSGPEIAEKYGVSKATISLIGRGERRQHIEPLISEEAYAASKFAAKSRAAKRCGASK